MCVIVMCMSSSQQPEFIIMEQSIICNYSTVRSSHSPLFLLNMKCVHAETKTTKKKTRQYDSFRCQTTTIRCVITYI